MIDNDFTKESFKKLLETYGADKSRWPETLLAPAEKLMASAPEYTNSLLKEAKELDEALSAARVTPGTDILKARILGNLDPQTDNLQPRAANDRPVRSLKYHTVAAMMIMSFVLGFAGSNVLQVQPTENGNALMVDNGWEELAEDYGIADVYEWVGQDAAP